MSRIKTYGNMLTRKVARGLGGVLLVIWPVFFSCQKEELEPIEKNPQDTTIVVEPKDSTITEPKDTTGTNPKDTTVTKPEDPKPSCNCDKEESDYNAAKEDYDRRRNDLFNKRLPELKATKPAYLYEDLYEYSFDPKMGGSTYCNGDSVAAFILIDAGMYKDHRPSQNLRDLSKLAAEDAKAVQAAEANKKALITIYENCKAKCAGK